MIEDATITYIRTFVLLSVSWYRDTHESIFSREKWERVQELLDYWAENMGWKARPGMHSPLRVWCDVATVAGPSSTTL